MDYRVLLRDELEARCLKNPGYSARAFSRDLGVSPSFLSQVLHGRKALNEERALMIAERLDWPTDKQTAFTILVRCAATKDPKAKARIHHELERSRPRHTQFHDIDTDTFRTIAEWHHYAIVELAKIEGFKPDRAWIARKLGISPTETQASVERLKRIGLLTEIEGQLNPHENYSIRDIPSAAIRSFHGQMLRKADRALREQSMDKRDFSGITMAIDPDRLADAKDMIRRFRRELMTFLEGGNKTAVYHLSLQLFRLDKDESK